MRTLLLCLLFVSGISDQIHGQVSSEPLWRSPEIMRTAPGCLADHPTGNCSYIMATPLEESDSAARRAAIPMLVAGGAIGGALGFVVGARLLAPYEFGSEYLNLGVVFGGGFGEALLLPLGVHLVNGGKGNYWRGALISSGIMLGAVVLAVPTHGLSLLAAPPLQLVFTIRNERRN